MQKKILVLLPVTAGQKEKLESATDGKAEFLYRSKIEVTKEEVQNANIILGNVPLELIQNSRQLELLQLNSAGTGDYIREGALPKQTKLTNATGAYGLALSEHMLGLVFMLQKKLHYYRDNQNQGLWQDEGEVKAIFHSTTLIVGLGDIGGEFAKRMKALGSTTIGIRRAGTVKPDYLDELYHMDALDQLLPKADIVAISLPGTAATYHIFDENRLEKMKKGAILINVGRGTVVDTQALCSILEKGYLAGAALDVTDPEPLPKNHPLWKMKNVLITPHIAGDFHLKETLERLVELSAHNIHAYFTGDKLKNEVDFSTGYRKLEE